MITILCLTTGNYLWVPTVGVTVMPLETSIPCTKEARDLVKAQKEYDGQSYDELLKKVFGEREESKS